MTKSKNVRRHINNRNAGGGHAGGAGNAGGGGKGGGRSGGSGGGNGRNGGCRARGGGGRGTNKGNNNNAGGGGSNRGGGQQYQGGGGRGRTQFTKFVDFETRNKQSEYGKNIPWAYDNYNSLQYNSGGFNGTTHMYNEPTARTDVNQIPPYQEQNPFGRFEFDGDIHPMQNNNNVTNSETPTVEPPTIDQGNNEAQNNGTVDSTSSNSVIKTPLPQPETKVIETPKLLVNIKQEKMDIKTKTERKSSSSSSSSSSSDSSSSEDKNVKNRQNTTASTATVIATQQSSAIPVVIKLKPIASLANSTTISQQTAAPLPKKLASSSSSSSSTSSPSDDEKDEQPPQPPKIDKSKNTSETEKAKKRPNKDASEDDVVCMGKLENKIVVEDDDEDENLKTDASKSEESDDSVKPKKSAKKRKKSDKKCVEKCMLCDKKGHTSFQCQMICKNCSAPYHGFRTCPEPANINTMLQMFMEFCMQQLRSYQPEKQFLSLFTVGSANANEAFPKPLIDSPSTNVTKSKKRKHQLKGKDPGKTLSASKKRKITGKRKRVDDDDDDSDSTSETEETSSESDSSSEGFESLNTKKSKKSKANHKSGATTPAFNTAGFMPANAISYNLGLGEGMPNITAASTNPQLNTLLLTQMFQNAMGSRNNK